MIKEHIKQKIIKIAGPIIGTTLCIGIVTERMAIYAESLQDIKQSTDAAPVETAPQQATPLESGDRIDISGANTRPPFEAKSLSKKELKPLGEVDQSSFSQIKTRADACVNLNGRLIAFYDQTALIENCKVRLIDDPLLLNLIRKTNTKQIIDVPSSVYRLFQHGKPIRESDISGIETALGLSSDGDDCKALNKQYVTVTGVNFYYIENCKKRRFLEYAGLEEHNQAKRTIKSVTPAQLARIPDGPDMTNRGTDVSDVWIQIDGDAGWQRASRPSAALKEDDTPAKLREIAKQQKLPIKPKQLCAEINGHLVSFYDGVYFVENCKLRPITDQTLELQIKISSLSGIRDLSANEKRALKVGDKIEAEAVLKKLK